MDILLIHQAFAALDEPGGTRHHEFARHLQTLGHRITIITGKGSYMTGDLGTTERGLLRQVDDLGVVILRTAGYQTWHRSFFHRLLSFISFMLRSFLAALRNGKVDLVWGTSPPIFQAVSAAALARWRRVPFLLEVRDLWPYFAVASGVLRSKLLIRLSNWLERWLYEAADVVVVNSPGYVQHVRERGAQRVELVPNGVDWREFSQVERDGNLRAQLGLGDAFLVLYAGAHGLSNDLGTLLRAAKELRGEPHIHIALVGAGKEKAKLVAQAQAWDLRQVHFLDPVPKQKMPELLSQADAGLAILMAIDAYKTTYPNKVFDYMAAGLPVLCQIDGVIREVVESGQAGIFVRPGDEIALAEAIRVLAADRTRARELGLAGKRLVRERYDRAGLTAKLESIMKETLHSTATQQRTDESA